MGKELCKSCLSGSCLKDGEDGKLTMSQPHGLQSAGLAGLHWDQVRTPPSLLTAELKPSHFGKGEPYKQKNVAPLKTDKRRATGMVSEQEIWAKTGWTGALPGEMMEGEGLEETGAERLWGLSPESPLLKEGCNCSYVFDRYDKNQSLASHREGRGQAVGTWPGAATEQEKQLCNSYRNQNTPRQLLKWKTSIFTRQQHLWGEPPAAASQVVIAQTTNRAEVPALQRCRRPLILLVSNRGRSGGQEKRQNLEKVLGFHAWEWGLAETCIKWKDVVSSSLILWQQIYDLPALPTTNNLPELIGGIRRSQHLL